MANNHNMKKSRLLRVFLCHITEDKPIVRDLNNHLRLSNIDTWFDEENLIPGQNWKEEVLKAITTSDAVIVCLSNQAITKAGYIHKEIRYAFEVADEQPEGTVFIIPIKLDDCKIPDKISDLHCIELFDDRGYIKLIRALQLRSEQIGVAKPKLLSHFDDLDQYEYLYENREIEPYLYGKREKMEFHNTLWNTCKTAFAIITFIVAFIVFDTLREGYSLESTGIIFLSSFSFLILIGGLISFAISLFIHSKR